MTGDSQWPAGRFAAGQRVGRFLLKERIGRGGMAWVFQAHDERLGRDVALKILAPDLAADSDLRQRFIRESRAAAAVGDPNIIHIYEADEADGILYIAMPLVAGGDVGSLMARGGPLPAARAALIISAVASALDAAHEHGLVHRDVKPGNILLDSRPNRPDHIYLSDFGISKNLSVNSTLTRTDQFLGTLRYAAPELFLGRNLDGRADQYALACVAFELLSGSPPFVRDRFEAYMYAHLSEQPPRLSQQRPAGGAALDAVFDRALAKDPGDRYPDCGAFASDVRSALGLPSYGQAAENDLRTPTTPVLRANGATEPVAGVAAPPAAPTKDQPAEPRTLARRTRITLITAAGTAVTLAATAGGIVLASGGGAGAGRPPPAGPSHTVGGRVLAGLAPSTWPMFQHDPLHTGLAPAPGIAKPVLAWKLPVRGQPGSPVIGPDGAIYVATGMPGADKAGFLYAITPGGKVQWRFALPGLPASTAPAVAADGTIYVHTNGPGGITGSERLVAVTPRGTRKWIVTFRQSSGSGTYLLSSPVVGPDGTIYLGSGDARLYAVTPEGTVKWAVSPSASPIQSSPALDASRNVMYFQDAGFELWAYRTDKARKWRAPICASSGGEASATANPRTGVIYTVASACGAIYAINPDGTIKWHRKLGGQPVSTPAIGPDGTIYVGANGLYAFTPAGALKWKRLGYTLFSSASPVVAKDGTIYWNAPCASSGAVQGLCAVNPDGTVRWQISLPSPCPCAIDPTPAVAADGSLYVSAPDDFSKADQTVRKYTSS